jgi:hypothetical protein
VPQDSTFRAVEGGSSGKGSVDRRIYNCVYPVQESCGRRYGACGASSSAAEPACYNVAPVRLRTTAYHVLTQAQTLNTRRGPLHNLIPTRRVSMTVLGGWPHQPREATCE